MGLRLRWAVIPVGAAMTAAVVSPPAAAAAPRGADCPTIAVERSVRGPGGSLVRDTGPDGSWQPGEVLLRFRDGVSREVRTCVVDNLPARVVDGHFLDDGGYRLRLDAGVRIRSVLAGLRRSGLVSWAVPNGVVRARLEVPEIPPVDTSSLATKVRLPNDPYLGRQWYLFPGIRIVGGQRVYTGIGATSAWSQQIGSKKQEIAVVDSNIESTPYAYDFWKEGWWSGGRNVSEQFARWSNRGYILVEGPPPVPHGQKDHGTRVASVIAGYGNNNHAGVGVMWRSKLLPTVGVEDDWGRLLKAMDFLGNRGVRVVNVSLQFGATEHKAGKAAEVDGMLTAASEVMGNHRNTLWVFAASNEAFNNDYAGTGAGPKAYWPMYARAFAGRFRLDFWTNPAKYPPRVQQPDPKAMVEYADNVPCALREVKVRVGAKHREPFQELGPFKEGMRGNLICVAATDRDGQLATFSSYGRHTVEFAAPGEEILLPERHPKGIYQYSSGTSYAAPLVTGVAGLVRSSHPSLSAVEIKCVLMRAAQRAPLPPQDITVPTHPAFLQPPDKPLVFNKAATVPGVSFQLSPERLPADQLLRVMGIPNAAFALDEADRLALDNAVKKSGATGWRLRSACH